MKRDVTIGQKSDGQHLNTLAEIVPPRRILVPVDASSSAFNSLAYTLHLAKAWNAGIHLYYVIDFRELPDSDSEFVFDRVMSRLERKASICLEALRELIQEVGVVVDSAESKIGNVKSLLRNKIDAVNPDMIVIGRGSLTDRPMKSLVAHSSCPVLIVPEAATPRLPLSVLLVDKNRDVGNTHLTYLVGIIRRTSEELHIISPSNHTGHGRRRLDYSNNDETSFPVYEHQQRAIESVGEVDKFVTDHAVDITCTFFTKQSILDRILGRSFPLELANKLSVPVLIIREWKVQKSNAQSLTTDNR